MSRDDADKARFLRALAFEIRRKRPPEQALEICIEREGRGGRHRVFRQASNVLAAEGFVPALLAAELVGDDVAVVLAGVAEAGDHRLLADVIDGLGKLYESNHG